MFSITSCPLQEHELPKLASHSWVCSCLLQVHRENTANGNPSTPRARATPSSWWRHQSTDACHWAAASPRTTDISAAERTWCPTLCQSAPVEPAALFLWYPSTTRGRVQRISSHISRPGTPVWKVRCFDYVDFWLRHWFCGVCCGFHSSPGNILVVFWFDTGGCRLIWRNNAK